MLLAGAEKSTIHIIQHLNRSIFTPVVICLNSGGSLEDQLNKINVKYYILNKGSLTDISGYVQMWKLLQYLKIDILHTQLFEAHIYGRIAGIFSGVSVIVSTYRNSSRWLESKALRNSIKKYIDMFTAKHFIDALIGVSEGVRNYYKYLGYKNRIFDVIYNSVNIEDTPKENKSDYSICDEYPIRASDKVIVAIGRSVEQKGYEYLFPAFKKVERQLKNVKLLVFGLGQNNGYYQKLATELELNNSIIFCGVKDNIYEIFSQADLFVSSSLWEGLPRAHLEACLSQCPVISTDIPGSNEVISHNVNGWLVPSNDSDSLAEGIIHLLNDTKLCKKFTTKGLEIIKEKFDIKKNTERLERLYLSLLYKK